MIRAHLQKVHDLKPMRALSSEDMSESFYAVRNARRNLRSMLTPDQLSDYQFLHQLETILDEDSKREWEMRRDTHSLPTLDDMFQFLERRTVYLSSLELPSGQGSLIKQTDDFRHTPIGVTQGRRFQNQHNEVNRLASKSSWSSGKCVKCGKNCYALFRCGEFEAMTLVERAQFVSSKRLCRVCFSNQHSTEQCFKVGCQKLQCGGKHNSLLCPLNARFKSNQSTKKEAVVASTATSTSSA